MKKWLLLLFLACSVSAAKAQGGIDTAFLFTRTISHSVNRWIVFSKQADIDAYPFGFLYIDPSQGFVFNLEGFFKNNSGHFIRVNKKIDDNARIRYNIKPGPQPLVANISPDHYEELDIYPRPDWLSNYNTYTDTVAHEIAWAKAFNAIDDHQMALNTLVPVYHTDPHAPGLEAELANTFNELGRYNDAINVLDLAMANDPTDVNLYKEMGRALLSVRNLDRVLAVCDKGIKLCQTGQAEEKAEMALYMAQAFESEGDKQAYKKWLTYAILWAPKGSYIALVLAGM
jgi:tetratricopeptide (TPR) repeat protein